MTSLPIAAATTENCGLAGVAWRYLTSSQESEGIYLAVDGGKGFVKRVLSIMKIHQKYIFRNAIRRNMCSFSTFVSMRYMDTEGAAFGGRSEPGLTVGEPGLTYYAVDMRHGFAWLISLSVSIDEPRARLEVRFRQRHNVMITDVFCSSVTVPEIRDVVRVSFSSG